MYASTPLPPEKNHALATAFNEQRAAIEAQLPKEKTTHQFRVHFDTPLEGMAWAVYGGWPWEFLWLHYSPANGTGIHQLEAWKCKPENAGWDVKLDISSLFRD